MQNYELIEKILERVFQQPVSLNNNEQSSSSYRFYSIPGKNNYPRWIVPCYSPHGMVVLNQWKPFDLKSSLKWKFLSGLYQSKLLGLVPGVHKFAINIDLENWLSSVANISPSSIPVIYVGTPSPITRIIVLLVDTQKYEITSIIKVPFGEYAQNRINTEANILKCLVSIRPGLAPELMQCSFKDGIVAETPINGKPLDTFLTPLHLDWLIDLRIPGENTSIAEQTQILKEKISAFKSVYPEQQQIIAQIYDRLSDFTVIPAVIVHGDFAPWNLKQTEQGRLAAFDWERASLKGLPLFDIIHFYFIQAFVPQQHHSLKHNLHKNPYINRYMLDMGIEPALFPKFYLYYLLASWLQRLEDGNLSIADIYFKEMLDLVKYFDENFVVGIRM